MIKNYPNITWIITNIKIGQASALDQAYKHIETEYFFSSEDDWEYLRPGFIEYSLQALMFDPKLNGLLYSHQVTYLSDFFYAGPLNIITEHQLRFFSGLSLNPSGRRMKEYRMLEGGYTGATFNMSYGKGTGNSETIISQRYTMMGYHYAESKVQFIRHIGTLESNKFRMEDIIPPQ